MRCSAEAYAVFCVKNCQLEIIGKDFPERWVPQVSPFLRDLGNSRARYIPSSLATDTPLLLS
jgi:hypothetical protein